MVFVPSLLGGRGRGMGKEAMNPTGIRELAEGPGLMVGWGFRLNRVIVPLGYVGE